MKVKHFAECPHCADGEFYVDHLWEPTNIGREYKWFCSDCGKAAKLTATAPGVVRVERDDGSMPKTLNLLAIPPRDYPIYLVVHGVRAEDENIDDGNAAYFYDEHTCPTNWTGEIEAVIENGDDDPHGVARFVRRIDTPPLPVGEIEYDVRELFPEAFGIEGGIIIDGATSIPTSSESPPISPSPAL